MAPKVSDLITLSDTQYSHLESFKWLVNSDLGLMQGRTMLLIYVFIDRALHMRGKWVYVFDHTLTCGMDQGHAARCMLNTIKTIVGKDAKLIEKLEILMTENKFRFK